MTSRPLVTPAPIPTLRIVALLGSLRGGSLNQALLRAAREASPGDVTIDLFPLADVPFYDADLDREGGPATVRELKDAIAQADGLLIVTPEYNHSLPAVTKNAIDWASRPAFASPLSGKPVLVIGASSGRSAARHALEHAAEVLTFARAIPFERTYGVARAGDLVDDSGRLGDPVVMSELRTLLADFGTWVRSTATHEATAAAA